MLTCGISLNTVASLAKWTEHCFKTAPIRQLGLCGPGSDLVWGQLGQLQLRGAPGSTSPTLTAWEHLFRSKLSRC